MRKQSRIGIVITLIISLAMAGIVRTLAETQRDLATRAGRDAGGSGRRTSLAGMNSFALALLLGGLRGPLVMILWTQSEQQKQEKNLEGFDTRIEWIRLLQPEFDTVHIFQSWNKAYNISVQMASLANKYTVILDALEYLHQVDSSRPDNINIVYTQGQIYFDKLGNSHEKTYYRKRVRAETQQHVPRQKLTRDDPAWRRIELDPILDQDSNIITHYLAPTHKRPADIGPNEMFYDGSELQFLKQFEPYKAGVSPFAIAYNYYKRSQYLQVQGKQSHAQLSQSVVHSRPAVALQHWAQEEWELGRQQELTAFSQPMPAGERIALEMPAAKFAYQRVPEDPASLDSAIYCYERAVLIGQAAKAEYEFHLKGEYRFSANQYQSIMEHIDGQSAMLQADADYLRLRTVPADQKAKLTESIRKNYHEALRRFAIHIVRYYMEGEALHQIFGKPQAPTVQELEKLTDAELSDLLQRSATIMQQVHGGKYYNEDRMEYETYIGRCYNRLEKLGQ